MKHNKFSPPLVLRPAMVQTVIAGTKVRKRGTHAMEQCAQLKILECGHGARLSSLYSRHPNARGLIIVLHGWCGSASSTYVVSSARQLYEDGWSILRIDLPDHGASIPLNQDFLHAACFTELFYAVDAATELSEGGDVHLLGFSLGGNFALRVARHQKEHPILNLKQIFAVSPVITPAKAAVMIDESFLIRTYFRRKFLADLKAKCDAFPNIYSLSGIGDLTTISSITAECLRRWSEYSDIQDYFNDYQIMQHDLAQCPAMVTAISAADDPVVPGTDLNSLENGDGSCFVTLDKGGHNGFFSSLLGPTYYDNLILERLTAVA